MKAAASALVRRLDLPRHPRRQVGVVEYADGARVLAELTNREPFVLGAIQRVRKDGRGTAIDMGITTALGVLRRGRVPGVVEVMVVIGDGGNNAGCPPVLVAAGRAKGDGVLLVTACVGVDCDTTCMRAAASSPRYFIDCSGTNCDALSGALPQLAEEFLEVGVRQLIVTDSLPADMRFVPNSGQPQPRVLGPDDRVLQWTLAVVPATGVTLTYAVEPLAAGYRPTNRSATGVFVDNLGLRGELVFPVPYVAVLAPDALATPTPTVPSPTPTPTRPSPTPTPTPTSPSPTATPTVTPRPSPTEPPSPGPRYLPLTLRRPCASRQPDVDIALVIDVSTSMSRPTRGDRPKLAATLAAAAWFVEQFDLGGSADASGDRIAVVGFHHEAWIEQALADDRAVVHAGLARLDARQAEGTRLDLALDRGAEALRSPGRARDRAVLILLTDGLPNQVPVAEDGTMATTVLRRAAAAKGAGIAVYTIGIGEPGDTSPDLLRAIANRPTMYFHEPDAEDLVAVYGEIARVIGCP